MNPSESQNLREVLGTHDPLTFTEEEMITQEIHSKYYSRASNRIATFCFLPNPVSGDKLGIVLIPPYHIKLTLLKFPTLKAVNH